MTSPSLKAVLLIVSDTATRDPSTDKCTEPLKAVFKESQLNASWDVVERKFVSDDPLVIQQAVMAWTDEKPVEDMINVVLCSGGTGFARRDITPEVSLRALI